MRTIKGSIADSEGMRYSPNLEVIAVRDSNVSIHDTEGREEEERASEAKLDNPRIARKGKFY